MNKGRYGISEKFDQAVDKFWEAHEKFQKIYSQYESMKNGGSNGSAEKTN